jgi:O-antigen ligase
MGPTAGSVIFGSYLINLLAIALACWLLGLHRRDRIIGAIMTGVIAFEMIWSGTRSSVIAAIIIAVAALVLTRRFKLLLSTLTAAGIIMAIFFSKLLPLFAHNDDSTRPFLWQEALKLISTHPWIGIGLYQFPNA